MHLVVRLYLRHISSARQLFLLCRYVVFVVLLQCLVRQLASWMRKVDEEEDVANIARKAEIAQHSTFERCFQAGDIAKACFVAHRYARLFGVTPARPSSSLESGLRAADCCARDVDFLEKV